MFKLVERKGECQSSKNDTTAALESFDTAIKMIKKNATLNKEQRHKFIATIEKKMESLKEEVEHESNLQHGSNITVRPIKSLTQASIFSLPQLVSSLLDSVAEGQRVQVSTRRAAKTA